MRYDAFISYAHAVDDRLAPALQAALQRFAKPWRQRRALRIFRDQSSLAAAPELWPVIQAALDDARYFILLASPEAAQSRWVRREVAHWRETRPLGRLLIVLTGGELIWDEAANDFDWARSDALPPELKGAFPSEPLWVDLRWAHDETQLSLKHPRFLEAVGDLAAPLHGRSKEDLLGEDLRQHRRTVLLAWGAIAGLVLLMLASLAGAGIALEQRGRAEARTREAVAAQATAEAARIEAETQQRIALSRQLAAQAINAQTGGLDARLLLAVEANRLNPGSVDARGSLLGLLADNPDVEAFLPGRQQSIDAIGFRPDGAAFVSAGPDGVMLWDTETRQRLAGPVGANGPAQARLAISPDGAVIAASWQDGLVSLLDGNDLTTVGQLQLEGAPRVAALTYSPDGDALAIAGQGPDPDSDLDDSIGVWDVSRRQILFDLPVSAYAVAFGSDGETLLAGGLAGSLSLWQWRSGERLDGVPPTPERPNVSNLAVNPNGTTFVVATADGALHIRDLATLQRLHELSPPKRETVAVDATAEVVTFSPDGRILAAAGGDGVITRWDVRRRVQVADPLTGHGAAILGLAFSPDGSRLISGAGNGTVVLWRPEGAWRIGTRLNSPSEPVYSLAMDANETVAAGDATGGIHFWTLRTGRQAPAIDSGLDDLVLALRFSPDGRYLAAGDAAGYVGVWDMDAGTPLFPPLLGHADQWVFAVVFARNGEVLASAATDGMVHFWDAMTGQPLPQAPSVSVGAYALFMAQSPDGRQLAVATEGGVRFIDVSTFQIVGDLVPGPARGGDIASLAYSPDGSLLAASGTNGIAVIDVATRQHVAMLHLPQAGETSAVAFSPDGATIAAGGADGSLRLWDVASRQSIGQFPAGHSSYVNWLIFTADGRFLISNDIGGDLFTWEASDVGWITAACAIAGRNLTSEEWMLSFGDAPYEETCPDVPASPLPPPLATPVPWATPVGAAS